MGGAVSSGRDNDELIDNLITGNYIRTKKVERVFRVLDRADYMTPETRDQAYKDLAWRNGLLHLSSPCIYSEVMEGLDLRAGLSFLNIGSGTGYLSTLVGLILGSSGINHGIEIQPSTVNYSVMKLREFIEISPTLDEFDFCEPNFFVGNGLNLAPLQCGYDRVYCGAGCPQEYESYFKSLIKVGGILVLPINDTLLQVKRVSANKWVSRSLLSVSFATLCLPARNDTLEHVKLVELVPPRLQVLARARIRESIREGVLKHNPDLKEKPWPRPPRRTCPRRICIPIEPGGDVENLNVLHDLDPESGANEMNALLSLVISMGQNGVAGALRVDRVARRDSNDSGTSQNDDEIESSEGGDDTEGSVVTVDDACIANAEEDVRNGSETVTDSNQADEESKVKTDDTKDRDKAENEDEECKIVEDYNETDSLSDSSSVNGFVDKVEHLRAKQARIIARCKRLSKKIKKEMGLGKPSTSQDSTSKENEDTEVKNVTDDDAGGESSGDDDDMSGGASRTKGGVPSEVEIVVPKNQEPGTSVEMDWLDQKLFDSEDEAPVSKRKAKRQKLNTWIGENGSSCPERADASDDTAGEGSSDDWVDIDSPPPECRSGRSGRRRAGASTTAQRLRREALEQRAERRAARLQARWRRKEARSHGDSRRSRLASLMKRAVYELPLPHPLRLFVNLGRFYQL